ncbi:MAG: hypothetical protein AB7U29_11610 [Desulfobulbus sp.]
MDICYKILKGLGLFILLLAVSIGSWYLLGLAVINLFKFNKLFGLIVLFIVIVAYGIIAGYAKTGEQFSRSSTLFFGEKKQKKE